MGWFSVWWMLGGVLCGYLGGLVGEFRLDVLLVVGMEIVMCNEFFWFLFDGNVKSWFKDCVNVECFLYVVKSCFVGEIKLSLFFVSYLVE